MEGRVRRFAAVSCAGIAGYLALSAIAAAVTLRLSPNGVDDTPQLQAALESCSGAVVPCRIVLDRGTFRTRLLLVSNFRGQIRGQGADVTRLQPVPYRYLKPSRRPFDAPPTLSAPYPALLHFTDGGHIEVANLTLNFPSSMRVIGWYDTFWGTLQSAILVDGGAEDRAHLRMSGVAILARPCRKAFTLRSHVMAAVLFGGRQAYFPFVPFAVRPERLGGGSFTAKNTFIRGTGIGFAVHNASHLDVRIVDNDIQHTRYNAVSISDLGGSEVRVLDNRIAAEGTIINGYRGFHDPNELVERPPPSNEPTSFLIARNSITLTAPSTFGADPVVAVDWLGFAANEMPGAGIDTWVIWNNDIVLGAKGRGITVLGDRGHALVGHNRIWGGDGMDGLIIDNSVGTRTYRNTFLEFPEDRPTVSLGLFTRECRVREPDSIVLDNGEDNHVIAREVLHTAQ